MATLARGWSGGGGGVVPWAPGSRTGSGPEERWLYSPKADGGVGWRHKRIGGGKGDCPGWNSLCVCFSICLMRAGISYRHPWMASETVGKI